MFKAVLFDLDGTLLYTLTDVADAMNKALAHFGFPAHPVDAYKYFIGESVETEAHRALPASARDPEFVRKVAAYSEEIYDTCWGDNTHPYTGIPELLTELQRRGLSLVILSNKNDRFTKVMVEKILPRWRFKIVQGALPNVPLKPDPTLALQIAKKLKIPPEQFLYLGDTNTDMQTALAAGMFPVGCLWGYRTADELLASGAKLLITNPAEILQILDKPQNI
ncbi:MAG: HAD family hydrolase [Sedimentisphaerales bacterium]|jgi:phosphoglycolate phosphatase